MNPTLLRPRRVRVLSVATVLLLALLLAPLAHGSQHCRSFPVCDYNPYQLRCQVGYFGKGYPSQSSATEVATHLQSAFRELVGQGDAVKTVFNAVVAKVRDPSRPLVLHFAGDNGVGKTLLATLISLATSLREARDSATGGSGNIRLGYGENLLKISGPSYKTVADIASTVDALFYRVSDHLRMFPHGVILLDDVNAMDPLFVEHLGPLLGRGSLPLDNHRHYTLPDIGGATIVLTSDFGKEGRTRRLSSAEIARMAKDDMREVYSAFLTQEIRTVAFLPFAEEAIASLTELSVKQLSCREPAIKRVTLEPVALQGLVELIGGSGEFLGSNGRAVKSTVKAEVDEKVAGYLSLHPGEEIDVTVTVDNEKRIVVRVRPVDGSAKEVVDL